MNKSTSYFGFYSPGIQKGIGSYLKIYKIGINLIQTKFKRYRGGSFGIGRLHYIYNEDA